MPSDASLHDPERARAAMRLILAAYQPHVRVMDDSVQPGDVVIVGPVGGGPGHVLMGGFQPNTLWHAVLPRVCFTGIAFNPETTELVGVYRMADRRRWLHE